MRMIQDIESENIVHQPEMFEVKRSCFQKRQTDSVRAKQRRLLQPPYGGRRQHEPGFSINRSTVRIDIEKMLQNPMTEEA